MSLRIRGTGIEVPHEGPLFFYIELFFYSVGENTIIYEIIKAVRFYFNRKFKFLLFLVVIVEFFSKFPAEEGTPCHPVGG